MLADRYDNAGRFPDLEIIPERLNVIQIVVR
jgi:hypothetical protein